MKPITAAQPLKKQRLECVPYGFRYQEGGGFGMGELAQHAFHEIDAIMRADGPPPMLHIQVGRKIYSIRYNAGDADHLAQIETLVAGAKAAQ